MQRAIRANELQQICKNRNNMWRIQILTPDAPVLWGKCEFDIGRYVLFWTAQDWDEVTLVLNKEFSHQAVP